MKIVTSHIILFMRGYHNSQGGRNNVMSVVYVSIAVHIVGIFVGISCVLQYMYCEYVEKNLIGNNIARECA